MVEITIEDTIMRILIMNQLLRFLPKLKDHLIHSKMKIKETHLQTSVTLIHVIKVLVITRATYSSMLMVLDLYSESLELVHQVLPSEFTSKNIAMILIKMLLLHSKIYLTELYLFQESMNSLEERSLLLSRDLNSKQFIQNQFDILYLKRN